MREIFINIDEESSNITEITNKAREGFQNPNLSIVNANLLKIEDSDATRSECEFNVHKFIIRIYHIMKAYNESLEI